MPEHGASCCPDASRLLGTPATRTYSGDVLELEAQFGQIDIYLFDQLLRGRIKSPMRVLDAGCGSGRNLVYLLRAGCEVFAADSDAAAVEAVRRLAGELAPRSSVNEFSRGAGRADDVPRRVRGRRHQQRRAPLRARRGALGRDGRQHVAGAEAKRPSVCPAGYRRSGSRTKSARVAAGTSFCRMARNAIWSTKPVCSRVPSGWAGVSWIL